MLFTWAGPKTSEKISCPIREDLTEVMLLKGVRYAFDFAQSWQFSIGGWILAGRLKPSTVPLWDILIIIG